MRTRRCGAAECRICSRHGRVATDGAHGADLRVCVVLLEILALRELRVGCNVGQIQTRGRAFIKGRVARVDTATKISNGCCGRTRGRIGRRRVVCITQQEEIVAGNKRFRRDALHKQGCFCKRRRRVRRIGPDPRRHKRFGVIQIEHRANCTIKVNVFSVVGFNRIATGVSVPGDFVQQTFHRQIETKLAAHIRG